MKANVGPVDRLSRVIFGLALLSLLLERDDPFRWFGLIGIIPLLTGITSYCPFYTLLVVSSCTPPNHS
jgi:hypothetical protein